MLADCTTDCNKTKAFPSKTFYEKQALRSPLEELKARDDRRRKKEVAAQAVATVGTSSTLASAPAFPGVSSTSFGASLYAMASSSDAGTVGRGAKRLGAELGVGGGSRGGGTGSEWREEDVMAVVDQVRGDNGLPLFVVVSQHCCRNRDMTIF